MEIRKKCGRNFRFFGSNFFSLKDSPLLLISKECSSHFCRETAKENKQSEKTKTLIFNSDLIRQSFQGYVCKSGIAIFAWRIT